MRAIPVSLRTEEAADPPFVSSPAPQPQSAYVSNVTLQCSEGRQYNVAETRRTDSAPAPPAPSRSASRRRANQPLQPRGDVLHDSMRRFGTGGQSLHDVAPRH